MAALYEHATVGPHVYMGTLRTLVEEEDTVEEMQMVLGWLILHIGCGNGCFVIGLWRRFRRRIGDGDEEEMRCGDDCCWGIEGGDGVVANFFNSLKRNVRIFRVHPKTGSQMQLSSSILLGKSGCILVDVYDVFIAYDGHGVVVKKFLVEADENVGTVDFTVEL
ncbi:hypothetical protein HJC23_013363 [Cyclotella cryptica]|uniref:Uncharacterized protein n=1 Tax=Cyclotella cryptica TaxID=29204 RepID=A0ABD3P7Q9_9STRA